jgi:hypothetical protein
MPLARKVGAAPFAAVVADEKEDVAGRMRAVEVLTELSGGLPPATAKAGAKASSPLIRARVAWSLGHLAEDTDPRVRDYSLAGLGAYITGVDKKKPHSNAKARADIPPK